MRHPERILRIGGSEIKSKGTHLEVFSYFDGGPLTIEIPWYIVHDFQKKNKKSIMHVTQLEVCLPADSIIEEKEKLKECQNIFRSPGARSVLINEIDWIALVK